MRIIFCNTAYLRYYDGRIAGELTPTSGGRWVQENEDAHEKWNFLNMDGYCYGFVRGKYDNIRIERINKAFDKQEQGEDVTVVWCAKHPETDKTVIVGWYKHATAFRYDQFCRVTPATGIDRCYQFLTKAEDAYLLPEEERTMEIGRASKTGQGTGFGQMNYWFADSDYAKENVIPEVLKYIEEHGQKRINDQNDMFEDQGNADPLTDREMEILNDENSIADFEFLQLAYRMYAKENTGDNAFRVGAALSGLFQYEKAIDWYKRAVEFDSEDWEAKGLLVYHLAHCEQYELSVKYAIELLEHERASEPAFRDEVYCMLADGYFFQGDVKEAIRWQDKILEESNNKDLLEHTKHVKAEWKSYC